MSSLRTTTCDALIVPSVLACTFNVRKHWGIRAQPGPQTYSAMIDARHRTNSGSVVPYS